MKAENFPTEAENKAPEEPMDYLFSTESDEEQHVRLVQVEDKGSSPQCARVLVQGVSADGIVDSRKLITSIHLHIHTGAHSGLSKCDIQG